MPDLWTQANEILQAVADELRPTQLERVYVANGRPAFDECPQLTIHLSGFQRGTPPLERPDFIGAPRSVIMTVTRTWCIPVSDDGSALSVADQTKSSKEVINEANALYVATTKAANRVSCRPSIIGSEPVEPSGGQVGWTVVLSWVPSA
jgi:hypothetical protein